MPPLRTYFNLDNASGCKLLPLELLIGRFEFGHISDAEPQKQMFDRSINQRAVIIFKSYIPLIPWVQKPIDVHTSVHKRGQ